MSVPVASQASAVAATNESKFRLLFPAMRCVLAAHDMPLLRLGETCGRYRILREIGRGGMGCVYLARDESLGRQVALKVILQREMTLTDRARFEREARNAARLQHVGIATIFDVGEHEGRPFFAMEYVEGETLAQRLRRGPLDCNQLLDLARQLSEALAAAHQVGVIHRDLKPGNIMCATSGRICLLDFGLARSDFGDDVGATDETGIATPNDVAGGGQDQVTRSGELLGTPAYMAPEQARGERISQAADVFALGVVLHEAATGRNPFGSGPHVMAVLSAVLTATPPTLDSLRSNLPPRLSAVVAQCLRKDPRQRFASGVEVVRALRDVTDTPRPGSEHVSAEQHAIVSGRVAVLPWRNTSRDPSHDWLGVGIADTVAHELRRSGDLSVLDDAQVGPVLGAMATRDGPGLDLLEVGRTVSAAWVVTGSYQVAGQRLRIVGMAADVATGTRVPCDRADGHLDDVFDLQDTLVSSLRTILGTSRATSTSKEIRLAPDNADAYEWYARAMAIASGMTPETAGRAEEMLAQAIDRDPNYALAFSALGQCRMMRSLATGVPPLAEAIEPLRRAITLNPQLAEAHLWLSHILLLQANYTDGAYHGRLATSLNPKNAHAAMNLGIVCGSRAMGDELGPEGLAEAIASIRRAVELEPNFGGIWSNLGMWSMAVGDFGASRLAFERALALESVPLVPGTEQIRWVGARVFLGAIELYEGRRLTAERELNAGLAAMVDDRHMFAHSIEVYGALMLAECHLRAGRLHDARDAFASVVTDAESKAMVPGMWQFGVRAQAGRVRSLALMGERTEALARAADLRVQWNHPQARRRFGYAALGSWSAYDVASAWAALGDHEGALDGLDDAHRFAWCAATMLDGDPCFAALHGDPRLGAIRSRAEDASFAIAQHSRE